MVEPIFDNNLVGVYVRGTTFFIAAMSTYVCVRPCTLSYIFPTLYFSGVEKKNHHHHKTHSLALLVHNVECENRRHIDGNSPERKKLEELIT